MTPETERQLYEIAFGDYARPESDPMPESHEDYRMPFGEGDLIETFQKWETNEQAFREKLLEIKATVEDIEE